jgi:hypothetical protein
VVCLCWTIGNDGFRSGQEVRPGREVTVVADALIALQAYYCHELRTKGTLYVVLLVRVRYVRTRPLKFHKMRGDDWVAVAGRQVRQCDGGVALMAADERGAATADGG